MQQEAGIKPFPGPHLSPVSLDTSACQNPPSAHSEHLWVLAHLQRKCSLGTLRVFKLSCSLFGTFFHGCLVAPLLACLRHLHVFAFLLFNLAAE